MIRLKTQHANQPKVIILTLAFVISLSDLFLISHSQPKLLIETHYKTRHRRYNQILIYRQKALAISDLRDLWWKMSRGTQDLIEINRFLKILQILFSLLRWTNKELNEDFIVIICLFLSAIILKYLWNIATWVFYSFCFGGMRVQKGWKLLV